MTESLTLLPRLYLQQQLQLKFYFIYARLFEVLLPIPTDKPYYDREGFSGWPCKPTSHQRLNYARPCLFNF
jgi:hypothetical protein